MTSFKTSSGSTAEATIADAKDSVKDVAGDLRSSAQDLMGTVTSDASRAAHHAQGAAADEVKNVASALRTAADELRSGSPQERTFSQLADGLADAADAMRDKDLGEVIGDLNAFARRNPLAFLGGAALVGFAATRFAKASTSHSHGSSGSDSERTYDVGRGTDDKGTSAAARPAPSGTSATPSAAPSSAAYRATDPTSGFAPGQSRTTDRKGDGS